MASRCRSTAASTCPEALEMNMMKAAAVHSFGRALRIEAADSRRLAGGDPTGLGHMVDSLGEMAAPTLDTSCGPAVHRSDEAGPAATGCSARPVRARALTRNWRTAHVSTPRELRSPDSGEHDSRGLAWLLRAAAK